MVEETKNVRPPAIQPILRGLVTFGLLTFSVGTQVFVVPTHRNLLAAGERSVPAWLTTSIEALPWIVVFVIAAATAFTYLTPAEEWAPRRRTMLAVVDFVLTLWVWILGLFFFFMALEIPRLSFLQ